MPTPLVLGLHLDEDRSERSDVRRTSGANVDEEVRRIDPGLTVGCSEGNLNRLRYNVAHAPAERLADQEIPFKGRLERDR